MVDVRNEWPTDIRQQSAHQAKILVLNFLGKVAELGDLGAEASCKPVRHVQNSQLELRCKTQDATVERDSFPSFVGPELFPQSHSAATEDCTLDRRRVVCSTKEVKFIEKANVVLNPFDSIVEKAGDCSHVELGSKTLKKVSHQMYSIDDCCFGIEPSYKESVGRSVSQQLGGAFLYLSPPAH
jgi:hypothetical protein